MKGKSSGPATEDSSVSRTSRSFVKGFHGVRYQTSDVSRAAAFYTEHLGFELKQQHLPAFATISLGSLHLLLSGPEASGSSGLLP